MYSEMIDEWVECRDGQFDRVSNVDKAGFCTVVDAEDKIPVHNSAVQVQVQVQVQTHRFPHPASEESQRLGEPLHGYGG
jgi:hypothetical protein